MECLLFDLFDWFAPMDCFPYHRLSYLSLLQLASLALCINRKGAQTAGNPISYYSRYSIGSPLWTVFPCYRVKITKSITTRFSSIMHKQKRRADRWIIINIILFALFDWFASMDCFPCYRIKIPLKSNTTRFASIMHKQKRRADSWIIINIILFALFDWFAPMDCFSLL